MAQGGDGETSAPGATAAIADGPKPSLREKAYAFARERATARTCDFTAVGIPRHYLAWMCEEGLLVKVGYGVYRAANSKAA